MIELILNKDNYFDRAMELIYMGSSSIKAWDVEHKGLFVFGNWVPGGCEARELAVLKDEYEKPFKEAFLVGQYVHAAMESRKEFQKLINDNYDDIYGGKLEGSKAPFKRADKMIRTLRKDSLAMAVLEGEKERIFTGSIGGQKIKIRIDALNLHKGHFTDLKTTNKLYKKFWVDGKWGTFIDAFDYRLQFAIYSEILYQNIGRYLDMYIVAVDKKPIPELEIIYMGNQSKPDSFVPDKLREIEHKLPRIIGVRNGEIPPIRCEKCEYCLSTKKLSKPVSLEELEYKSGIWR